MALQIENLKKDYVGPDGGRVPILDIPALSLADGEQVALVGSSGSGKTTLLHLIAGILTPDYGRIVYDISGMVRAPARAEGEVLDYQGAAPAPIDIVLLPEAQRDRFRGRYVGYIFQTHHLLPGFTALENVLLGMSFTGRSADEHWAQHLLAEVGLSDRLGYKPSRLSVGQQQRVAVARALANRPRLVLADEPTGALDAGNAQQVLDLIRKLCREINATLLVVSHDPNITAQFPRVVHLSEINRV